MANTSLDIINRVIARCPQGGFFTVVDHATDTAHATGSITIPARSGNESYMYEATIDIWPDLIGSHNARASLRAIGDQPTRPRDGSRVIEMSVSRVCEPEEHTDETRRQALHDIVRSCASFLNNPYQV